MVVSKKTKLSRGKVRKTKKMQRGGEEPPKSHESHSKIKQHLMELNSKGKMRALKIIKHSGEIKNKGLFHPDVVNIMSKFKPHELMNIAHEALVSKGYRLNTTTSTPRYLSKSFSNASNKFNNIKQIMEHFRENPKRVDRILNEPEWQLVAKNSNGNEKGLFHKNIVPVMQRVSRKDLENIAKQVKAEQEPTATEEQKITYTKVEFGKNPNQSALPTTTRVTYSGLRAPTTESQLTGSNQIPALPTRMYKPSFNTLDENLKNKISGSGSMSQVSRIQEYLKKTKESANQNTLHKEFTPDEMNSINKLREHYGSLNTNTQSNFLNKLREASKQYKSRKQQSLTTGTSKKPIISNNNIAKIKIYENLKSQGQMTQELSNLIRELKTRGILKIEDNKFVYTNPEYELHSKNNANA